MKKVIKGAVCDTETATKLGSCDHDIIDHLHWWSETLYWTKSGRYFIYGEGGPASPYSIADGDGHWKSGEQINIISRKAAEEWAEKHLTGDEYEAAFGLPDEVPRITVELTPENRRKLDEIRAKNGMKFVEIINDAISAYQG